MTTIVSTTPTAPTAVPATPPVSKGRKGAAAGGGKAWTEEEEVYLLQMRLERVAYKKIASHLEKTELACRLHYHQLSHGGNRRKRTNSVGSNSSVSSATSPGRTPETSRSKALLSNFSPINAVTGAIQKPGSLHTPKVKGKPLLPKPSDSSSTPRKSSGFNNSKGKPLRVNCTPDDIDRDRLGRIVRQCEAQLWQTVAQQYGDSVDPDYLKRVWQEGVGSTTPPTPAVSPAGSTAPAVDAVNEVSTPASSLRSPTVAAFEGSEVASIKEEAMEDEEREEEEEEEERETRFKEQSVSDTDADADAMEV